MCVRAALFKAHPMGDQSSSTSIRNKIVFIVYKNKQIVKKYIYMKARTPGLLIHWKRTTGWTIIMNAKFTSLSFPRLLLQQDELQEY